MNFKRAIITEYKYRNPNYTINKTISISQADLEHAIDNIDDLTVNKIEYWAKWYGVTANQVVEMLLIGEGFVKVSNRYFISPNGKFPFRIYNDGKIEKMPINFNGMKKLNPTFSMCGTSHGYINRIVYELFVGKIPTDMRVVAKDGNLMNWKVSNLELRTRAEVSSETIQKTRAEKRINSKRTVTCNETDQTFDSVTEAARWIIAKKGVETKVETVFQAISKHISGNKKHKTVHSYTFRRGI